MTRPEPYYGAFRDEHGGLTVAGLRAALAEAPDDALVLVHDDETDDVGAIASAGDDGPSTCIDDPRHIFRITATSDELALRDAAEQDDEPGDPDPFTAPTGRLARGPLCDDNCPDGFHRHANVRTERLS